jgi:hypothetical protein
MALTAENRLERSAGTPGVSTTKMLAMRVCIPSFLLISWAVGCLWLPQSTIFRRLCVSKFNQDERGIRSNAHYDKDPAVEQYRIEAHANELLDGERSVSKGEAWIVSQDDLFPAESRVEGEQGRSAPGREVALGRAIAWKWQENCLAWQVRSITPCRGAMRMAEKADAEVGWWVWRCWSKTLARLAALTRRALPGRGACRHRWRCRRGLLLSHLGTGAAWCRRARTPWSLAGR